MESLWCVCVCVFVCVCVVCVCEYCVCVHMCRLLFARLCWKKTVSGSELQVVAQTSFPTWTHGISIAAHCVVLTWVPLTGDQLGLHTDTHTGRKEVRCVQCVSVRTLCSHVHIG